MVTTACGVGARCGGCGRTAPSLLSCSLAATLRLLTRAVKRRTWPKDKAALAHLVHTHVPHNLRNQLQRRVLRDCRLYDTVSLRLLEVVLSSATTSLSLVQVRAFYRDDLTRLLHSLTGLHHLGIQDPGWTLDGRQLKEMQTALGRMEHLRVLILQYCAHDLLLAALAPNCPHLQVIDVRGSRGVSDCGVWSLVTQPTPCDMAASDVPTRKRAGILTCWGAAVKSLTSRMLMALSIFSHQKSYNVSEEDREVMRSEPHKADRTKEGSRTQRDSRTGEPWQDTLSLSPCCSRLTHFDLRGTSVTRVGVTVIIHALSPHALIEYDPHLD